MRAKQARAAQMHRKAQSRLDMPHANSMMLASADDRMGKQMVSDVDSDCNSVRVKGRSGIKIVGVPPTRQRTTTMNNMNSKVPKVQTQKANAMMKNYMSANPKM